MAGYTRQSSFSDGDTIAASLLNNVTTPYTIAVCEDMVVKGTKEKVDNCIREFIRNDFDYMFQAQYLQYPYQKSCQ